MNKYSSTQLVDTLHHFRHMMSMDYSAVRAEIYYEWRKASSSNWSRQWI